MVLNIKKRLAMYHQLPADEQTFTSREVAALRIRTTGIPPREPQLGLCNWVPVDGLCPVCRWEPISRPDE
jgi:hypothetical protein